VLSNDEGVQNWYRVGGSVSPHRIGTEVADLCVSGLLVDPRSLTAVRAAADSSDS